MNFTQKCYVRFLLNWSRVIKGRSQSPGLTPGDTKPTVKLSCFLLIFLSSLIAFYMDGAERSLSYFIRPFTGL